jgi:Family of unknown function (DUF5677)
MSLDNNGFLSEDIFRFQKHIHKQYAQYFDLIHRVNAFCQQAKFRLSIHSRDGREMAAACLIIKLLNDMQAAILLAERGMAPQARTLIRTGLEAFIILANVCRVDEFWRSFFRSDQKVRLKLLRAIHDNPSVVFAEVRPHVTPELIDQLNQEVKEMGITEEKVIKLAYRVKLMHLYDSLYRLFSQDVHSSPRALEEYCLFDQNDELAGFKWGPKTEDLAAEFTVIPRIMILGFAAINELFDLKLDEALSNFDAELKLLENPPDRDPSVQPTQK